jgi:DNA-binding winged helix-turn-helix (wHTH) protein
VRTLYSFGPFDFDPGERLLLRGGSPVSLPPKALDVLAVLVSRAGQLVSKDELVGRVWYGVAVEDSTLCVVISRLRAALGEEGRGFIKAVPRYGYRFLAPVTAREVDPSLSIMGRELGGIA